MAKDCGKDLIEHNITMISFYPGVVKTELAKNLIIDKNIQETNMDELTVLYLFIFFKIKIFISNLIF